MNKKSSVLRIVSLSAFLALLSVIAYLHQIRGGGPEGIPPIDAFCPFGGMETLYRWLTEGSFMRRVAPSSLVIFSATVVMAIFLGRAFCGWICPLGAIGEFSAFLGRKLRISAVKIGEKTDGALKYLKYVLLIVILAGTYRTDTLVFRNYDPWVGWAHLTSITNIEYAVSFAVLFIVVIGASVFIERFWCRYLCPQGALLGIISKASMLRVGRQSPNCASCGICRAACPMRLQPDKIASPAECIVCGKCTWSAPYKCGVSFRFLRKHIKAVTAGIAAIALLLIFIGGAKLSGSWITFVMPSPSEARMSTESLNESIFGWMNLEQVSELSGIPVSRIKREARLKDDVSETEPMRSMGITNRVREAVLSIYTSMNVKEEGYFCPFKSPLK